MKLVSFLNNYAENQVGNELLTALVKNKIDLFINLTVLEYLRR